MKHCTICREEKALDEFQKCKQMRDGRSSWCKKCKAARSMKYYFENRGKCRVRKNDYYARNRDYFRAKCKAYSLANKECLAKKLAARRAADPGKRKIQRAANRVAANAYPFNRRRADPLFAMVERLRARTKTAFRGMGWTKAGSARDLLGCEFPDAKIHLESQFAPGMSWDNRNLWHIDHRVPLSSAKTPKEMAALCHYSNLQPLWAIDNMRKHSKMPVAVKSPSSVDSMTCGEFHESHTEA